MGWVATFFRSSIGSKFLMALTGILLLFFVLGHMTGNLLIFQGAEALNAYAHWLHDHPKFLWTSRIVLLAIFVIHVTTAIRLKLENMAARPVSYVKGRTLKATLASRSMVFTGLLLLAYILFHLLHFTLGVVQKDATGPSGPGGEKDVYAMVVTSFGNPVYAAGYILAIALLWLHLWHGIASFFQTMGWSHPRWTPLFTFLGKALSLLIFLGYVSVPFSVLTGLLKLPAGGN